MKIEHIGYMVEDPAEVAEWYSQNLGFQVRRKLDESPYTHFLADASGQVMVEIYNNPKAEIPDYAWMEPLVLHIAFEVEDVEEVKEDLSRAGASVQKDTFVTTAGDQLVMLRDPWGFAIQLVKRKDPMI